MEMQRLAALRDLYRAELLSRQGGIAPFWLRYCLDKEHGGYFSCLDRDGSVYSTDKYLWLQGRILWFFAKLYNEVEARPEWLEAAALGEGFIQKFGFNEEGRMYFRATRDGKPLFQPWSVYTEIFTILGLAEYSRAAKRPELFQQAKDLFWKVVWLVNNPDAIPTPAFPENRPVEVHAIPMVLISTAQELNAISPDPRYHEVIDYALDCILNKHAKPEKRALFENIAPDGSLLEGPEGRCLNPGHAIESAWFCLREGQARNDKEIIRRAEDIIEWSLERGWDKEHGGILYFVDYEGRPPDQLEWDMKLWWPHAETLYALLLAYHLTGKAQWAKWYERVHEWTFRHFPDPEYGEWFGYLHRDGTPSLYLKGSMWKSPFHIGRTLLLGMQLLQKMQSGA